MLWENILEQYIENDSNFAIDYDNTDYIVDNVIYSYKHIDLMPFNTKVKNVLDVAFNCNFYITKNKQNVWVLHKKCGLVSLVFEFGVHDNELCLIGFNYYKGIPSIKKIVYKLGNLQQLFKSIYIETIKLASIIDFDTIKFVNALLVELEKDIERIQQVYDKKIIFVVNQITDNELEINLNVEEKYISVIVKDLKLLEDYYSKISILDKTEIKDSIKLALIIDKGI